jgi:hypothetical protein
LIDTSLPENSLCESFQLSICAGWNGQEIVGPA